MKKNKLWLIIAAICLALGVLVIYGVKYYNGRTEGIVDVGISTGDKNQSLAYDRDKQILYVGSHTGILAAYQGGEELWKTKVEGAYSKLVLDRTNNRLYTANENNHVYVYQASDGNLVLDINVQRKVVGIDVNGDETKIAIITNTGSTKSNLIIYSTEGEELNNKQYKISLRGIQYCEDGETLILADKRGDVSHINENGEVLNTFSTGYEIKQMVYNGSSYWVVCRDGTYQGFDESLNSIRKGTINNTINAKISSIGVDVAGDYVIVGTEEGYLYVMDSMNKQIYSADLGVEITGSATNMDGIWLTGYGDFVTYINTDNLANIDVYHKIGIILKYTSYVLAVVLIISILGSIPRTQKASVKLLKRMWASRMAYVMLIPTFVLLYLFSFRGIFTALTRAFTDWSSTNDTVAKMDFIGLDNFKTILTEGYFLVGIKNLLLIMITNIIKTLTVPMAVAWLLFSIKGDRRKYIHRFFFVLPMVVPGVVGAMIWQKIYDPSIGLLNQILGALNQESLQRVWLGDADTAIWAIIFVGFPFVGALALLVYYGGFINISSDVIESADIDGGNKWNIFWKVQLPMIRPQISVMMTLTVLGAMQEFNTVYIMTSGGPGTATYVPALELYLNAAQYGRYGYASALGVILLIFTMTVTLLSNKLTKEKE